MQTSKTQINNRLKELLLEKTREDLLVGAANMLCTFSQLQVLGQIDKEEHIDLVTRLLAMLKQIAPLVGCSPGQDLDSMIAEFQELSDKIVAKGHTVLAEIQEEYASVLQ